MNVNHYYYICVSLHQTKYLDVVTYVLQRSVFSFLFRQHILQQHTFQQRGLGHLHVAQNHIRNERIPR